ncbi:phosphate regulon sensor histidine kinase PhoR [Parachitinimonas caeni]|uniref:Phosphate regulon sensor protein PhoR n=1 Tax=Parachitinimonas caeni TaxID=3031301 RepID=A0ABT7E0C6_9NEIS|nr:phosphate regulon sensor histidine kinase PhoR [Parachitinimonas caeni]MDK2124885.1 phosphate regulon sensor histidine kinase PhoR [Parachitinimonas caeni]
MMRSLVYWWRTASALLAGALMAGIVYLFAGPVTALWVMLIITLLVLAIHTRNLVRLGNWLTDPQQDTVPESFGAWDIVYNRLYRLVRAQHKSQRMLSAALDRFVLAGEAMPEGVVVLDEQNRIEWCNPKAMLHLGLDRRQDLGQQISYLVRQPAFNAYLSAQDFGQPMILRNLRGNEVVLSVQLVPFDSTRKLLLSRDITQIERVQTIHRDFVANVSHELRTPLTVVGGFIETLIDIPDIDPQLRSQQLRLMHEQAMRMQRLVEDLLTLSRLENGVDIRDERFEVAELVKLVASEARGLSQGRHQITLSIDDSPPMYGSYDELHSAFGNLVSNAVRYTPDGGEIRVSWKYDATTAQGSFSVEDTGIGIDPIHIPRLTERFYRIDRGRSRATGGTGLGLAIVKHIVQRHQAKLDIQSEPGKGSRFSIQIPANRLATSLVDAHK